MKRVPDLVGTLARVVLGGVLLAAGAVKVGNPLGAARAVQGYDVLPFEVAAYVGYALPWIEVVLGVLLIAGLFTRVTAALGGGLMLVFVAGIAQAWARGLSIDCGCFGGGGQVAATETKYASEIVRDVALAAAGGWLVVRPDSWASLDRVLFAGAVPDRRETTTETTAETASSRSRCAREG